MAEAKRIERPLSPFMIGPYYRPQMSSISSIMIRITGIASLGTAFLVVLWLLTAATSESAFAVVDGIMRSFLGDLVMFALTWAIWYHVLGRLRHVIWDFCYFIENDIAYKMGVAMFVGATVLTIFTAIVV